jgi:predicted DNA-binding antitoxin AbrB/MazE fold protein
LTWTSTGFNRGRPTTILAHIIGGCYGEGVTTTVEAIYENGTLKLAGPLPLREKARVVVTVQTTPLSGADTERQAWLKASEETLTRAWDNSADDIFNELLDK